MTGGQDQLDVSFNMEIAGQPNSKELCRCALFHMVCFVWSWNDADQKRF